MSKIVTIHQPDFAPWIGYFDRIANSDLYLILDDVQFNRRGWHNRDQIKGPNGLHWHTMPIKKGKRETLQIRDVELDLTPRIIRKLTGTLKSFYSKAPNFEWLFPRLETMYSAGHKYLIDLNLELIDLGNAYLGIQKNMIFSSDLGISSKSTKRIIDLVKAVSGDHYLTGDGSRSYLDEQQFSEQGIRVMWQQYVPKPYPQLHGEFCDRLSIIDFMFMGASAKLYSAPNSR